MKKILAIGFIFLVILLGCKVDKRAAIIEYMDAYTQKSAATCLEVAEDDFAKVICERLAGPEMNCIWETTINQISDEDINTIYSNIDLSDIDKGSIEEISGDYIAEFIQENYESIASDAAVSCFELQI